jgi:hypothetical protein
VTDIPEWLNEVENCLKSDNSHVCIIASETLMYILTSSNPKNKVLQDLKVNFILIYEFYLLFYFYIIKNILVQP